MAKIAKIESAAFEGIHHIYSVKMGRKRVTAYDNNGDGIIDQVKTNGVLSKPGEELQTKVLAFRNNLKNYVLKTKERLSHEKTRPDLKYCPLQGGKYMYESVARRIRGDGVIDMNNDGLADIVHFHIDGKNGAFVLIKGIISFPGGCDIIDSEREGVKEYLEVFDGLFKKEEN